MSYDYSAWPEPGVYESICAGVDVVEAKTGSRGIKLFWTDAETQRHEYESVHWLTDKTQERTFSELKKLGVDLVAKDAELAAAGCEYGAITWLLQCQDGPGPLHEVQAQVKVSRDERGMKADLCFGGRGRPSGAKDVSAWDAIFRRRVLNGPLALGKEKKDADIPF